MENYSTYWNAFTEPLENTLKHLIAFVPRFMVAGILFLIFYGVSVLIRAAARRWLGKLSHVPWAVRILLARMIYLAVLTIGLLVALSAANVNVTTFLASLGVVGFAIGFALKDILENFISGILLLFARPFEVGDQVTLAPFEGTVEELLIRTTTLRTYADETVIIPNSRVYTNPVVNHTRLGRRRYMVEFDTSLTANTEMVEHTALTAAKENQDIMDDPPPLLRIVKVVTGNDVMSWQLFYWAQPTKAMEVQTMSALLTSLKRSLFDAGVPTPTSTSATILRGDAGLSEIAHAVTDHSDSNYSVTNHTVANNPVTNQERK